MRNIAIIGCGNIGRLHSKNLSRYSNLYFHSRSRTSAERFDREFGGQGVYDCFDDVLNSPKIDALVICSPPGFHKEQIIRALQAGKSVLVEKPMCISETELEEIECALERTAVSAFLMIAENYYYKPSLKNIKCLLQEKYIGDIQAVQVNKSFKQPAAGWKSQYGALLEGGIHFIALISDLFDDLPARIDVHFPGIKAGDVERHSVTKLTYSDGVSARLTYSWNTPSLTKGIFQRSSIVGDHGCIWFESNGIYVYLNSTR